jgi:hypothetical protein
MVHLTYNAAGRRKCALKSKIELFTRYHSEMPCKVCPKRRRGSARTVSRYHAGADRSSRAPYQPEQIPRYHADRAGIIQRYAVQHRPIPTGTKADQRTAPTESARNDHTKPEQLATVNPHRFFAALRSGDCAAGSLLPYCLARKCFLRFFCADFCELRLMLICGNS